MRRIAVATLCAVPVSFAVRCASSPGPETAPAAASRCVGTLGFDAGPLTRAARKRLGLPEEATGAVVTEVFAGGPAANAGLQANDIVERIGDTPIRYDCDVARTAYNRSCAPVTVTLRRGGEVTELTLTPVDQDPFLLEVCKAGNMTGCFRAAWLQMGRSWPDPRVLELFSINCKGGSAEACAYEGLQLSESADTELASVDVLKRACDLQSGSGCASLAFLYATGKAVAKDDKRAATLYRKSCELGDAQGCYNAGLMSEGGRGVKEDLARAAADYDEACELGSSTACTNLGFLYERGRGVREDKARAVALYQRGCDGSSCAPSNLGGCVNVGRAYRDGIGVAKNEAKAAEIFREACERVEEKADPQAAQNGARACSLLGGLLIAGEGIPKDLEHGRDFSILGCERGDSFGCFNAAVTVLDDDPARAASYYERACNLGDGESCHELATAYQKGTGVGKDASRAKALEKRACELGFAASCPKVKKKK
jgi:TPR repeat protein